MRPNPPSSFSDDLVSDARFSNDSESLTYEGMDWEEYQRMDDLEPLESDQRLAVPDAHRTLNPLTPLFGTR